MNIDKTSYPDNAMAFVFGKEKESWPEETFREGTFGCMNETLRRRFLMRFEEKKTLETIGAEEGVSKEAIRIGLRSAKRKILNFYFPEGKVEQYEIDRLGLSKRPYTVLVKKGYVSIEQVEDLSYGDLLTFRNIGVKSAEEVIAKVEEYKRLMDGETGK